MQSRYVQLLPKGTKLFAVNSQDEDIEGTIERYVFVEHTHDDGTTTHEVKYLVFWQDLVREYLTWGEVNMYGPVKPPRRPYHHTPRESVGG